MFLTFLGDFNLQKLPSRRLQTLWELKNRVLLEEYYIFNVVIPLEVSLRPRLDTVAGLQAEKVEEGGRKLKVEEGRRNCYIKNVALFEENSILLLPECLESSGW